MGPVPLRVVAVFSSGGRNRGKYGLGLNRPSCDVYLPRTRVSLEPHLGQRGAFSGRNILNTGGMS